MSASKVIADLEAGPPTLNVPQVARILGVSKSGLYEAIRRGDAPVKTLRVLGRIKVSGRSVFHTTEFKQAKFSRIAGESGAFIENWARIEYFL